MTASEALAEQMVRPLPSPTVYVGESPDDLSVYAARGWDAWVAMWTLIAEWSR